MKSRRFLIFVVLNVFIVVTCRPKFEDWGKMPSQRPVVVKACWDTFKNALKDKNDFVKTSTIATLGRIGNEEAVETIIGSDLGIKSQVVRAAVSTIAGMRDSAAYRALLRYRSHTDFGIRAQVTLGLVRMRDLYSDTLTTRYLRRMLLYVDSIAGDTLYYEKSEIEQERQELKTKLVIAIRKTDPSTANQLPVSAYGPLGYRVSIVQFIGLVAPPRSVELLNPFMRDSSSYVREKVAEALGKIGTPETEEPIRQLLRTERREDIIINAAIALMKFDEAAAVEHLVNNLGTLDEDNRSKIILALGEVKRPEIQATVIPRVRKFLDDPSDWARISAVGTLGSLNDSLSIPLIEKALNDPAGEVREIAVGVLASMKGRLILDSLVVFSRDEQYSMRSVALTGLSWIDDRAIQGDVILPLLYHRMKFDEEMIVRVKAAFTLLDIYNDRKYTRQNNRR